MMNHAIRSVRTYPSTVFLSPANPQLAAATKPSRLRLRQFGTLSTDSDSKHNMGSNPAEKTGDAMSHSFGEGYSTRSDEEGFGGIYGGNQSVSKVDVDKEIHENHPAYDKSQGSEVKEKEKEKARHQTNANS